MLRQFQNVFTITNHKITLGSSNFPQEGISLKELSARAALIEFYRKISDNIISSDDFETPSKEKLYTIFILALLAELYKVGNCGEYSAVGFVELLLINIQKHLEIIEVTDNKRISNHCFILYNRTPESKIDDPTTYGNIIMFDAWPGVFKVQAFSDQKNDIYSKKYFFNCAIKELSSIESIISIDKNFTYSDWADISTFFYNKRFYITKRLVAESLVQFKIDYLDSEEEAKKIQNQFIIKAQKYGEMAEKTRSIAALSLGIFGNNIKTAICAELARITGYEWKYSTNNEEVFLILQNQKILEKIEEHFEYYGILPERMNKILISVIKKPSLTYLKKIPTINSKQRSYSFCIIS